MSRPDLALLEAPRSMNPLADLTQSRDLLVNLTLRELRGKYKRSVLGWSWSLLNPLATMVIFSVVFGRLIGISPTTSPSGLNNYPAFLLCGLLAWNFLANGMNGSMVALLGNAGLIKKVYFPREILVYATVLALDWSFVIEMGLMMVFLLILGNMVLPWILGIILAMVLMTLFVTGIGLMLSVLNVYFRDLQYLVGIGLQLWFYLTPIIYPITTVTDSHGIPPWVKTIYVLNPMLSFVQIFRSMLYDLQFPRWSQVAYVTVWSLGVVVIGMVVFRKFEARLAEEL
ncbi:MAG: ABC transporter permease [Actinomycetes bacterium]